MKNLRIYLCLLLVEIACAFSVNGNSYAFSEHESQALSSQDMLSASPCDTVWVDVIDSFCVGGVYSFGGGNKISPGIYQHTFLSSTGCDSVVTLFLTHKKPIKTVLKEKVCNGGSYNFNGNVYSQTGVYSKVYQTLASCDSTVELQLEVLAPIVTNLVDSFCRSSNYIYNTSLITAPGNYSYLYSSELGCDSVVNLQLNHKTAIRTYLSDTICAGQIINFGTQMIDDVGVYVDSIVTTGGCDSIVRLTVTNPLPKHGYVSASTCAGSKYNFNGRPVSIAGSYDYHTQTVSGCDSIVTLTLSVIPVRYFSQEITLAWDSVYIIGNNSYNKRGVYIDIIPSSLGCDSIVTTEIKILFAPTPELTIPKYFTPNGDGLNDYFVVDGLDMYPKAFVEIYDRFSKRLIQYSASEIGWDGTSLGKPMPTGTYWYLIRIPEVAYRDYGYFLLKR